MADVIVETLAATRESLQIPSDQVMAPVVSRGRRMYTISELRTAMQLRSTIEAPTGDELIEAEALGGYLTDEMDWEVPLDKLGDQEWLTGHNPGIIRVAGVLTVALDRGRRTGAIPRQRGIDYPKLVSCIAADYLITACMLAPTPGAAYRKSKLSAYYSAEETAAILHGAEAKDLGFSTVKWTMDILKRNKRLLPEGLAAVRGLKTTDAVRKLRMLVADAKRADSAGADV